MFVKCIVQQLEETNEKNTDCHDHVDVGTVTGDTGGG
jgi:hypothetical protein